MLGRRILRIKAFKTLYGYAVTGRMTLDEAMENLDKSCEATRDLYLYMLAVISPLTAEAAARIKAAKEKFNPTEEDLSPNTKFAENRLAALLDNDPDFQKILSKKGLSWQPYDILIASVLDSVREKEYFKRYMASPERSLKEDCKLFTRIFEEEFADNAQLHAILEDKSIYWTDDIAYALTFCCHTLKDLAAGEQWRLPELYQSDMLRKRKPAADLQSDREFVRRLLKNAFAGYEGYFARISEALKGWSSDRLNCIDIALIVLGLAEAESFPEIPVRVTINEYVEISKFFSLKSSAFVNGVLDRLINKMEEEGKISKKPLARQ